MSRVQAIRLAQFWSHRLVPLLDARDENSPFRAAELFEAVGWLNEGVFCRYFDAVDADVVWIQIQDVVSNCEFPAEAMPEDRIAKVRAIADARRPFRDVLQMTSGGQRSFELPLFSSALMIADRFARDWSAAMATRWLWGSDDGEAMSEEVFGSVQPQEVAARLAEMTPTPSASTVVAGYLRLIEHMQASREFFDCAAARARGSSVDFDSYCDRIGGLNAWRVPLYSSDRRERFTKLNGYAAAVFRREINDPTNLERWATFEMHFIRHFVHVYEAWEVHHMQGFFAH